jgi:hypothetical protein
MNKNICQYKGDTHKLSLEFTAEVDGVETPHDITGSTIVLTLKKKKSDSDAQALLTKTVTSHSEPTEGRTVIVIDPADIATLDYCDYVYDIVMTQGSTVNTVQVGHWEIQERVKD